MGKYILCFKDSTCRLFKLYLKSNFQSFIISLTGIQNMYKIILYTKIILLLFTVNNELYSSISSVIYKKNYLEHTNHKLSIQY